MSTEDNQHLHINIYKDNKDTIDKASNMSETFLIKSNEEFSNKIRVLLDELSTTKNELETLLDDNSRMEVTVNNQRGLLHNFNALKKYESQLAELYREKFNTSKQHMEEIEKFNQIAQDFFMKTLTNIALGLLIFILLGLVDGLSATCLLVIIGSSYFITQNITPFDYNEIRNINKKYAVKYSAMADNIKNKESEINEITSKSDFISDYIDSV